MDVNLTTPLLKKIRNFLIFFYAVCLVGCKQEEPSKLPDLQYKSGKAIAVTFPRIQSERHYQIYRAGEQHTPVLGEFIPIGNSHRFEPLVPFTAGQSYVIRSGTDSLAGFTVPFPSGTESPVLDAIYPLQDTVPENLLKVYLKFSHPMQAVGKALDFIQIRDNHTGEKLEVFLDLEAELWDDRHRLLTLWLDPGRIKKGLIPNRNLGVPLRAGGSYTLAISGNWRDANSLALGKTYRKTLIVGAPDRRMPDVNLWQIRLPKAGSTHPLELHFNESMDLLLAVDACRITRVKGAMQEGEWDVAKNGYALVFTPSSPWESGEYTISMDARTEDLAGNTFQRLFDTDLERAGAGTSADSVYRNFLITD